MKTKQLYVSFIKVYYAAEYSFSPCPAVLSAGISTLLM